MWFANHSQRWIEALETCMTRVRIEGASYHKQPARTSDGQLWTTSYELQITATSGPIVVGHDFNEVANGTALHMETMICFQRFAEG